jgi:hypothetical protein
LTVPDLEPFERLARDLAVAYSSGDAATIRKLNALHGTSFVWERTRAEMQRHLATWFASETRTDDLALADARLLVARRLGFESWASLVKSRTEPHGLPVVPPSCRIDRKRNTIETHGPMSDRDWDSVWDVVQDMGITGIATSAMTDRAMERLSRLDFVTRVDVGGAQQLTDDGLLHLARMPQLKELELGGWHSPVTDRGLEVLRHLKALNRFSMGWSQRVSDAGAANLTFCDQLESVNLMGTPTGDGAINALRGKRSLRRFKTGKQVTDGGIPLLHDFPVFKTRDTVDHAFDLMTFSLESHDLLLDGPVTDAGLAALAGLEGLFGLGFFWHSRSFTGSGLAALAALPNLILLGCQGDRCDDAAMHSIAELPRLRMLMGQGTIASDDGFVALSRSRTIEYIWGRDCPNLTGRGFAAMAAMPALRGVGVSCKHVDATSLAALPRFPSLRQLMPMDVTDDGFRHVGACAKLENLWCMYCQDTGDTATGHIAGLSRLKTYYAGKTRITDKSLEILGRMPSLERLELWETAGVTDAGLAHLAGLPRLREVSLEGLAGVTRDGAAIFPATVQVNYSP